MRIPIHFHSALFLLLAIASTTSSSTLAEEVSLFSPQLHLNVHNPPPTLIHFFILSFLFYIRQVTTSSEIKDFQEGQPPQQEQELDSFGDYSGFQEEAIEPLPSPTSRLRKGKSKVQHGQVQHHHYHYPHPSHSGHTPPYPPHSTSGRRFYIRHKSTGLYLDNTGGQCINGNNIQVWSFTGGANQMWYDGPNNTIMSSCCPNMVVDIEGGCHSGRNIHLWSYHGYRSQQFFFSTYSGCSIDNYNCEISLDVSLGWSQGNVMAWPRTSSSAHQQWERVYVG